jgi:hypothetical protein
MDGHLESQLQALQQSAALYQTIAFAPRADPMGQVTFIPGVGLANLNPDPGCILNATFSSLPFDANLLHKVQLQQAAFPEFLKPPPFEATSLQPNLLPQTLTEISKKRTFFEAFPSLDSQKRQKFFVSHP